MLPNKRTENQAQPSAEATEISDCSGIPTRKLRKKSRKSRGRFPATGQADVGFQKRCIPTYELLDESALLAIEQQADWILENCGVEFRGDAVALDLFAAAGASITGERAKFEAGHVRELCGTAPQQYKLHARDKKHTITVGGNHVVLMPGYGSPFVTDLEQGRRYATLEDFKNFVKLTYLTPWLHHSGGTVCEPTDIAVNKRHLDMLFAHLTLSTKPFMGSVTSPERAQDSIDMARIAFGADYLETHAVLQGNVNVNSPMVFDDTMSRAIQVYAGANQCVCVSPAIFAGAMGPLSPAAVAAQTLAEGMAGIALAQLVRPGCPVVFGSFHSTVNLKSGSLSFGSPEANLVTLALSQLGRRLRVPVRSGGGHVTSSNIADGQAMQESTGAMWSTLLSGAHQVWHAAGWLEGGLVMSYEKFVMDVDQCGAMLKMLQGFETNAECFGQDAYEEVNPGDNFLMTKHTLRHYATANFETAVPEAGPFEMWTENGALRSDQRATAIWKNKLQNYKAPTLSDSIREDLITFMDERKASVPDQWY